MPTTGTPASFAAALASTDARAESALTFSDRGPVPLDLRVVIKAPAQARIVGCSLRCLQIFG